MAVAQLSMPVQYNLPESSQYLSSSETKALENKAFYFVRVDIGRTSSMGTAVSNSITITWLYGVD